MSHDDAPPPSFDLTELLSRPEVLGTRDDRNIPYAFLHLIAEVIDHAITRRLARMKPPAAWAAALGEVVCETIDERLAEGRSCTPDDIPNLGQAARTFSVVGVEIARLDRRIDELAALETRIAALEGRAP